MTEERQYLKRLFVIALSLIFLLAPIVSADFLLATGTRLGVTSEDGRYIIDRWNVSSTKLLINDTHINISGLAASSDCITNTSGVYAIDSAECILPPTAADQLLWISDGFINVTSEVTILNFTGNLTDLTLHYSTTGGGNITLLLDDLAGDCNYGTTAVSGNASTVKDIYFDHSIAAFTECSVTLELNSTSGEYQIDVEEDSDIDEANLATIITATALSITSIIYSRQWDSET